MEQKRNERLPGAIALLIVVFTCVIALVGGRIITNATRRSGYDFKSVSIPASFIRLTLYCLPLACQR